MLRSLDALKTNVLKVVVAFCAVEVFYDNVVGWTYCRGNSMEPTIDANGEIVLIDRLTRIFGWFKHGDVIIAKSPYDPNTLVCKRLVGIEGDVIHVPSCDTFKERLVTIPNGHVWLQGDNLKTSRDSREYGPVPYALLQGRAAFKIWPLNRAGPFHRNEKEL